MSIPFVDLAAQFRRLEPEIRAAIDGVLAHGRFIMGPEVAQLERELEAFVGTRHAVACSSGTDALLLPLMAWGIGPGDAVITTPFTFIATAEVISLLGATPVFVDIDERTYNIDPAGIEAAVEALRGEGAPHPRCIIGVDLFGLPADYAAIDAIAARHDLLVLEDAAQSLGAAVGGRRAGSFGHAAATSFFPAKPLGCYGDGGAVFTDDDDLAERLRSIRIHGKGGDKYDNVRIGLNARLDTLQAAILLPKLRAFPDELEAREAVARRYTQGLEEVVRTPWVPDGVRSAWAQYSFTVPDRAPVQAALAAAGVPTAVYYPRPLHLQSAYAGLELGPGSFPVSESVCERILSVPMHPDLDETTQGRIIEAIRAAVA
jgi:dTDP-4-amino-4,6-dideoxygalactose transaminase